MEDTRSMQRLGKNHGGYRGECIDIHEVLRETEQFAKTTGWESAPLAVSQAGLLPAYRRVRPGSQHRVYISAGIHGDEPAGPLAVLKLFQQNQWPPDLDLWVIQCLNPDGYIRNCRENDEGTDLNRDYRSLKSAVVRAHVAWLKQQPHFDVTLLLHEDWESNGFYIYELNPNRIRSLAEAIIRRVQEVCPIDTSPEIEGRPALNGVICANPDLSKRPDWPEAFHLIHEKAPLSYTLEAPSDFPLATRVSALAVAVQGAIEALKS